MGNAGSIYAKRRFEKATLWCRFAANSNISVKKWKVFTKTFHFLCHCEERSDVAILKSKVWHPVSKHGSTKQKEIPITKNMGFATSFCFLVLYFKILFRYVQP